MDITTHTIEYLNNYNKVDCSKVYVAQSNDKGDGAFAKCDIKEGDLVERGIVRIIDIEGNNCPYVFTWSDDKTKWAIGSGCSTFYNSSCTPNTKCIRDFTHNKFEIIALRDIKQNEELTHTYKSINWRTCFGTLQ